MSAMPTPALRGAACAAAGSAASTAIAATPVFKDLDIRIAVPELAGLGLVQADGGSDEGHERLLIDLVVLVDVDGASGVALEARVEQSGGILQRGALEERELHGALVRLAGADSTLVRPHRNPWIGRLSPLPLLDHLGVGTLDQGADPGEGLAPPVAQLFDLCVDQLRWRLDVLRGALLHVLDAPFLRGSVRRHCRPPRTGMPSGGPARDRCGRCARSGSPRCGTRGR